MKKTVRAAMTILVAALSGSALTGQTPPVTTPQADSQALGQCMVDKSTGADRIAVARWMLAGLASAPQMADMVKVEPARKVEVDKSMARLFTRLLTVDCAPQARLVFKQKSSAGFEAAGGALGRIAVKELLSDPSSSRAMEAYTNYLNETDFAGVVK